MKSMKKVFFGLLATIFLASCSVVETNNLEDSIQKWNKSTVYQASTYVEYNGGVFKATTASKNTPPISDNLASSENPLGAWARSSLYSFRYDQKKLFVNGRNASPISVANLSDILGWDATVIYHGNDLIKISTGYYKSLWWNQNNNPNLAEFKNNFKDSSGTTHWGPWVSITEEEALALLQQQQEGVKPPAPDTGNGGNGENEGGNSGNEGGTVTPPPVDPPSGILPPEEVAQFAWSKTAIYLENDLAIAGGKYFRSKWWNQDHSPLTAHAFAWDSPWEEISEARFKEILDNGGATPPAVKPTPPAGGGTTPPAVDPEYEEIVKRGFIQEWSWNELPNELKDAFNKSALNGRDIFASNGDSAVAVFTAKINKDRWELLFPRRRGSKGWYENNAGISGVADYYSYENFISALRMIGDYAYLIDVALDGTSAGKETSFERNYILHKPTRTVRLINQSSDYFAANNDWLINRPHKKKVIDYAAFGSEGSNNDKARVIAGFLAHASHETSGSWETAPGYAFDKNKFPGANFPSYITTELPGLLAWSLYFNEEVHYANNPGALGYRQEENKIFPPYPGKSYHGRGAFQLSWNYNYGLASAIFFGTSKVLLEKPELIINGGTIHDGWIKGTNINGGTMAFLTSLMFWLTPQGAKPSQQDTMILNRNDGRYVPGTAKLVEAKGLGAPGYGWTINIMNGGFEAGKSWVEGHEKYDAKVARRVKHYLFFTQAFGGNNDGEILDTVGNHPY